MRETREMVRCVCERDGEVCQRERERDGEVCVCEREMVRKEREGGR